MKRGTVITLSIALVISMSAAAADAGKNKKRKKRKKDRRIERVASATYDLPAPGIPTIFRGGNCGSPNTGCAEFSTIGRERFVKIEVADGSGQPAYAEVTSGSTLLAAICGTTDGALNVGRGVTFTVWVQAPPDPTVCPTPGTSGTVKATLSNLP